VLVEGLVRERRVRLVYGAFAGLGGREGRPWCKWFKGWGKWGEEEVKWEEVKLYHL